MLIFIIIALLIFFCSLNPDQLDKLLDRLFSEAGSVLLLVFAVEIVFEAMLLASVLDIKF